MPASRCRTGWEEAEGEEDGPGTPGSSGASGEDGEAAVTVLEMAIEIGSPFDQLIYCIVLDDCCFCPLITFSDINHFLLQNLVVCFAKTIFFLNKFCNHLNFLFKRTIINETDQR